MSAKKIKIPESEYKLLKKIQKYVDKWINTDNGGKTIQLKNYITDECTHYQDTFIKANDRYLKRFAKGKAKS